jgi:hypothetical protein
MMILPLARSTARSIVVDSTSSFGRIYRLIYFVFFSLFVVLIALSLIYMTSFSYLSGSHVASIASDAFPATIKTFKCDTRTSDVLFSCLQLWCRCQCQRRSRGPVRWFVCLCVCLCNILASYIESSQFLHKFITQHTCAPSGSSLHLAGTSHSH